MDALLLSRWQFGITTLYHFLFVPLTLGLSFMVAIFHTIYYRTDNSQYKDLAKFFGKLFVINFALGVATGIVQEFQFGMNWSEYSRFVGDIFGVPLAIEALMAFFLESTFLGLWLFGWGRLPKWVHLASIWLVALGSTLSAIWILVANAWMQMPVGYTLTDGKPMLSDIFAVIMSEQVQSQVPHTLVGGYITGGLFVLGISAYHMLKKNRPEFFQKSFQIALIFTAVFSLMAATTGHKQAQHVAENQPMKLAAMEALWKTEQPASFSLFAIIDQAKGESLREIKLPLLLSVLAHNNTTGEVKGIEELQKTLEAKYGPGNYIPPVTVLYWAFRIMVGLGMAFILLSLWGLWSWWRGNLQNNRLLLTLSLVMLFMPYVANSAGWIVTEMGRQPWVVYGLLKTVEAVSPTISSTYVWISMIGFTVIYGVLAVVDVVMLRRYALAFPAEAENDDRPQNSGSGTGRLVEVK
ncbi:cytochrome ubiquinol oxidase subunit I [Deinococcus cellulosilyticus]|uniref:Cytochrome ubiquinol oxidase subunit I n=1 Tax=Deinococcus cellulosilyticus (strain DSM 18568 / NBRC 106333 / KACC 11606 / 5516J-15) TaxID=1223518 RepID=A0A511NA03_DEIC1|nr:cytochrome ubiquinol oxidase subunit I [Deinococcus cellulosilyticus]GEM49328.1 cytochrome ubiquinol oxidase subunit I [Deinococcus cellulosilyticus NBRC 106333 = KACC 11606]